MIAKTPIGLTRDELLRELGARDYKIAFLTEKLAATEAQVAKYKPVWQALQDDAKQIADEIRDNIGGGIKIEVDCEDHPMPHLIEFDGRKFRMKSATYVEDFK